MVRRGLLGFSGVLEGPVVDLLSGFIHVCLTTNLLTCIWRPYALLCNCISFFKNKRVPLEGIVLCEINSAWGKYCVIPFP